MANGKIAHYEQFHLLPQLFQKSSAAEAQEGYICGKGLKLQKIKAINNWSLPD